MHNSINCIHLRIYLFVTRLKEKEGELLGEKDKCRSLEVQVCASNMSTDASIKL